MKNFIKTIDELSDIAKILLCLPLINIVWGIYRVVKSLDANNTLGVVLGVLWVIFGGFILWIFDLVYIIINKKAISRIG
jgi:hypothetical protein